MELSTDELQPKLLHDYYHATDRLLTRAIGCIYSMHSAQSTAKFF